MTEDKTVQGFSYVLSSVLRHLSSVIGQRSPGFRLNRA